MLEICSSVLFMFGSQVLRFDYVFSLVTLVYCSHWFLQCMIMLFSQFACAALSVKNVPFTITALQQGRSQIFAFGKNFEMLRISAGCRPRLRRTLDNKSVKKNCTLPSWLNEQAEKANIDFSAYLQCALKEELELNP